MKDQNKLLLALAFIFIISTSVFAGKLKGKIIKPTDKGMLSIGGGTNNGEASTGLLRFDANVYVPVYSNQFMSFGFNAGGNYNSFKNDFQKLPTVYNMANQITNTAAFAGDTATKSNGYTLQVGPQANFHVGNHFIISAIIGLGLTNMFQAREYAAVQTTNVGEKSYNYDLLKVKQTASNGLCMTPKLRLNYMVSPSVGFWAEGSYLISPSVSTQTSTFQPEGVINQKGYYEERQLALGTYTTQTLTQSYNAVGINAGITLVLGGGNSERKGITEGGLKKTDEVEAFRKGWDGTEKGGSIQEKGITESGIKKTDGSANIENKTQAEVKAIAETLVNICKPDWDGSVKGVANIQAEVKSIAETLVNLTKSDGDGPEKGGSIQEKGITQSGIKKNDEMAAQRKGWDGTVKGGSIQEKGINQSGIKKNEGMPAERKGWDGSVKGSNIQEKAINQAGIKRTSDGIDNNCNGLIYNQTSDQEILIQGIDVNGIPFEHSMYTKGNSPLYQSNNSEHISPLYKGNAKMANPGCGSVTQKITYPDGKVEELNFACPADAAEYQQLKNGTTPKQTQGATFGEKVNAGLQQAESQIGQGASLLGGALPGGAVISAASVAENGNSGEEPTSISNVLKTKHDTAKNSVGNIRALTQNPDTTTTESTAARKGWDGSVKGSKRGIDKADVRKNASNLRKGWDGSVKGSSKGITEKGLK